jgi:hypothetical protein
MLWFGYTDAQLTNENVSEASLDLLFWDGTKWVSLLPCVDVVSIQLTTA